MKRTVWLLLVLVLLGVTGCANVTEEADKTFIDTTKLPLMFNPVDKEAERMLYESMYTSPVKWNEEDLNNVLMARGTLNMASDYLEQKQKLEGGVTFFALREFLGFTTYAFSVYEKGGDGRAYQSGLHCVDDICNEVDVLTDREQWIYNRVKQDVWSNLDALRAYVEIVAADINGRVDAATLERFKQAFSIVETIIPVKLPTGLDF